MLDIILAALYGLVQGVTEWLPVSSTGHMLLLNRWLPLPVSDEFSEFFFVAVQLGSLIAIPILFWERMDPRIPTNRRIWAKVLCAVLPAGICGLLFDDFIDAHLHTPLVIAAALIIYGAAFLRIGRQRTGGDHRAGSHSAWPGNGHRMLSGAGARSGNLTLRGNHAGWNAAWTRALMRGRVFVLSRLTHHAGRCRTKRG